MKKFITVLSLILITLQVFAVENEKSLNIKDIVKGGYKQLTGDEIRSQLFGKTIIINDLHTKAEYEVTLSESGASKIKQTSEASPSMLTDLEYHSRAPLLSESNRLVIKGDKVVASDGIRTFISRLYIKGNKILGVRDVDNGRVYLQIMVKP